jgi:hypothetical protein
MSDISGGKQERRKKKVRNGRGVERVSMQR